MRLVRQELDNHALLLSLGDLNGSGNAPGFAMSGCGVKVRFHEARSLGDECLSVFRPASREWG